MFVKTKYETERLYLKILKPSYGRQVLDYYKRNHIFFREWDPGREDDFYTIWNQKDTLRWEYNKFKSREFMRFWIFKKNNNKIIGNICFSNIVMGNFKSCFLGYKLDKDEINKGYMTEALKRCIAIMFDEYGLHRIEANIIPKNKRSLKVMEKLRFESEGASKRYLMINDVWEDHIHFATYNDSGNV